MMFRTLENITGQPMSHAVLQSTQKSKKHDWFMHVMKVIHFENNQNPSDRASSDCDRLWKIGKIYLTQL
jgi:hypothetical protein